MLQRVRIEGIELPRLYIAENLADARIAADNGLPYIVWRKGMDTLIKSLLRPAIEKLFPYINWSKVLGKKMPIKSNIKIVDGDKDSEIIDLIDEESYGSDIEIEEANDAAIKSQLEYEREEDFVDDANAERYVPIADTDRCCPNGSVEKRNFEPDKISVEDYIGDISSSVNIDILQALGMLPKFVGDVADCIKLNLSNRIKWTEGYNKKLASTIGNFKGRGQLPNLLIIDVSASIPDGIAATMITLAETLRNQCNADLIITSARSCYYPSGSELPDNQAIRDYFGRSNESVEFSMILEKYIKGREFGHVISFGDNDYPWLRSYQKRNYDYRDAGCIDISGTKVHEIHNYHTTYNNTITGYAKWAADCSPDVIHYDTSWCNVMINN